MPSPVVNQAVPVESTETPRRPQAPPLPEFQVMILCVGSSSRVATTETPAYVFAIHSTLPTRLSDQPLPTWYVNGGSRSSPVARSRMCSIPSPVTKYTGRRPCAFGGPITGVSLLPPGRRNPSVRGSTPATTCPG